MRTILRLITLLLIPVLLAGILFFIIYPNYSDIIIYKNSFRPKEVIHNASLRVLTGLSPRPIDEGLEYLDEEVLAVESVTPEALAQFNNSGKTYRKVEENHTLLSVDSVNIHGRVYDGEDGETMWRGLWHFPLSVGPGDKGNFVVIAHRFAKIPPETDTFFNLDQVRVGDKIYIEQKGGIKYTYTVIEAKTIEKDDRTILSPAGDHRITLITCHPLWTSKQRFAVVGVLDRVYQKT